MSDLMIHLTPDQESFVAEQTAAGGIQQPSDDVKSLVEERRLAKAKAELESLLLEGVRSPRRPWTDDSWDEIRREVDARRARKSSS